MLCQTKFNMIPSNKMALALLLGIIINADAVLILQTDQITWLLKCISLGDLS